MRTLTAKNLAWMAGYVAVIFSVIFFLNDYRSKSIDAYSTPEAQQNWQQWRDDAEQTGQQAQVARTRPSSAEPPSLVLMRDHFAACLGISVLLTSCLFVWLMVCVRGVMRPVTIHDDSP